MITDRVVAFRADGSTAIGSGHLSRCLGLVQELRRRDIEPVFFSVDAACSSYNILRDHHISVFEAADQTPDQVAEQANNLCASWMVIDHPLLDIAAERSIRQRFTGMLAVIDGQYRQHCCDVLINPNVFASESESMTTVNSGCRILAGPQYFILRDEFLQQSENTGSLTELSENKPVRVLITMGGSDAENVSLTVCRNILDMPGQVIPFHLDVVVGPSNPNLQSLRKLQAEAGSAAVTLHIAPPSLALLLRSCDYCICAGGITLNEAIYSQLPVIGVEIAANQHRTLEYLREANAILVSQPDDIADALYSLLSNASLCRSLVATAAGIIDGHGKTRIADALLQIN